MHSAKQVCKMVIYRYLKDRGMDVRYPTSRYVMLHNTMQDGNPYLYVNRKKHMIAIEVVGDKLDIYGVKIPLVTWGSEGVVYDAEPITLDIAHPDFLQRVFEQIQRFK